MKFDEWIFPDGEGHIVQWMQNRNHRVDGRLTYQRHKYDAALAHCKQRRTVVDVGAHVGLMSYWMARDFGTLHAFEPMMELAACWCANVMSSNAILHPFALGKERALACMAYDPADTGGTHIIEGAGTVQVRTLDEFELREVDFLKVDCEGYELAVLEGGEQTIRRWRPCIMVEQKPRILEKNYGTKGAPAVDFLRALGMVQRACISGDYILSFD